jgi:cytochrome c peroxidase
MGLRRSWSHLRINSFAVLFLSVLTATYTETSTATEQKQSPNAAQSVHVGRQLFEQETFGGNGRTCRTCHSTSTGTVSEEDAQQRFAEDPSDPLFLADGSDDGVGNGVTRMLTNATIRMQVPLAPNVVLVDDPTARSVIVNRGIPSTLNTPALDPVLMYDGRQPDLQAQAFGAVRDHAHPTSLPTPEQLELIADFQRTTSFFSSETLRQYAKSGVRPTRPPGRTASERRGRRFFEDLPFDPIDPKPGMCATCHSGAMLNETNEFIPAPPFARGGRSQSILVSELNALGNPVHTFEFTNPDGTVIRVSSRMLKK